MRKILAAALLLALLCGCTYGIPTGENHLTLYYRRADTQTDESFETVTGALAGEETTLGGDVRVEDVLARYFEGPKTETLVTIFPEGTACLGTQMQNGVLILDMNDAYATMTGFDRTLAAAGLTLTLTQFSDIETVQIKTPSGALLGQGNTQWSADDFILQDTSWMYPERMVQLYFVGKNGELQAEKRAISYQDPELLPENTLTALLRGPESSQLHTAIPSGTRVLAVRVTGTLCTVVLSEDFSACDKDQDQAERAVHSIAATLCGLSEIEQVQLQLENGEDLRYCSIAEPLSPESSWYN